MINTKLARIMTIAGSDSGGGAGIQGDIKTITALGGFATSAITAITAQNTLGVNNILNIPLKMIEDQILAILDDIGADAIKIGMLSNKNIISCVANLLSKINKNIPIVLDPVMVAKGGHKLLDSGAEKTLIKKLMPLCSIITPNIPEAEVITGKKINNIKDLEATGKMIIKMGINNVLMKGGHLKESTLTDILINKKKVTYFHSDKIITKNSHGTGCTLSSAIACGMAQKMSLNFSVKRAHAFVNKSIKYAPNIGKGNGPLNHLINNIKN
jgi:hydroxymethylpyrimidine/phosphomethylpyrimidine kinase